MQQPCHHIVTAIPDMHAFYTFLVWVVVLPILFMLIVIYLRKSATSSKLGRVADRPTMRVISWVDSTWHTQTGVGG
jgi:hypothetical protein